MNRPINVRFTSKSRHRWVRSPFAKQGWR